MTPIRVNIEFVALNRPEEQSGNIISLGYSPLPAPRVGDVVRFTARNNKVYSGTVEAVTFNYPLLSEPDLMRIDVFVGGSIQYER